MDTKYTQFSLPDVFHECQEIFVSYNLDACYPNKK